MMTMLVVAEQRVTHQAGLALLTPCDLVEMPKEALPRKPRGKGTRWLPGSTSAKNAGAAPSPFRTQQREASS